MRCFTLKGRQALQAVRFADHDQQWLEHSDVTVDYGAGVDTIGSAGANSDGCSPILGVPQITGSKDTETFDLLGAGCGLLNQAVDLQSDATQFAGGCVLVASTMFSNGGVTMCIATGTSPTSGTIKMNGSAEK